MMGLDKRLIFRANGTDYNLLAVGQFPGGREMVRIRLNRQRRFRLIRPRQHDPGIEGEQAAGTGQERIDVDLLNIEEVTQQITEANKEHFQLMKWNGRLPANALQGR